MRLVLVLALALAACSSPGSDPAPSPPATPAASLPGGLSAAQAASLQALGVVVLVPAEIGRFRLVDIEADGMEDAGVALGSYLLAYRRDDGACFSVYGSNEGVGGPAFPLVSRPVRLDALPGRPTLDLYEASSDPAASSTEIWGLGTVISDYIEVGDPAAGGSVSLFRSAADDGCRPLSLAEATPLFASLRLLGDVNVGPPRPPAPPRPPSADDLENLGTFADAPAVLDDPAIESGTTPEDAARGLADRYDGQARSVQVQVVQVVGGEATVLVTATGLADDSLDGERYRLRYRAGEGGTWFIEDAGVQVRCHAGRGHQDWSPEPCR